MLSEKGLRTTGTEILSAQGIGKLLPVGSGVLTLCFEAVVDLFSREICQEWPSLLSQIKK